MTGSPGRRTAGWIKAKKTDKSRAESKQTDGGGGDTAGAENEEGHGWTMEREKERKNTTQAGMHSEISSPCPACNLTLGSDCTIFVKMVTVSDWGDSKYIDSYKHKLLLCCGQETWKTARCCQTNHRLPSFTACVTSRFFLLHSVLIFPFHLSSLSWTAHSATFWGLLLFQKLCVSFRAVHLLMVSVQSLWGWGQDSNTDLVVM